MARSIILDCDPGRDDAVAIMLAHADPRLDLLGVTVVGGNLSLESCTRNALDIVDLVGADVTVYPGCAQPLMQPLSTAANIHGDNGIDGLDTHSEKHASTTHAVNYLVETIRAAEKKSITLVATGPLTNIALAVTLCPEITELVDELIIMGGAYNTGNRTAVAEFNVFTDPEAAAIVFGAPWRVVMIGLDVTHQALVYQDTQDKIAAVGTRTAQVAGEIIAAYREAYKTWSNFDNPPLHDVCAVAYAADPSLFTTQDVPLTVELTGEHTRGMTVADFRANPGEGHVHRVATGVETTRLYDTLLDALATCP